MNRAEAIDVLRRYESELRTRGVRRAAIFGSVARDEAGPASDVDILIDLDPDAGLDVFAYSGLKRFIASLFAGRVDVVARCALKPDLRFPAEQDAVYAFLRERRPAT